MKIVAAKILDSTHLELSEPLARPNGSSIEIAIPEPRSTDNGSRRLPDFRHREHQWRRSHSEHLVSNYPRQWVALEGEEIIAHGENPVRVVETARGKGIAVPYVFYVDPPRPGIVKIGL